MKPCKHETNRPGCRICLLYATRADYNRLWGGTPGALQEFPYPQRIPTRCRHLGPLVERSANGCGKCSTFDCAVAGRTTFRDCYVCPEYEEHSKRHLMMHLWPVRAHDTWRIRIAQLKQRWHVFTGIKAVSVAVDGLSVSLEEVRREFNDPAIRFSARPNTRLQEMESWDWLWKQMEGRRGAVFYCHGKGTRFGPGAGVHAWSEAMFSAALDYLPLVDLRLRQGTFAGSFKLIGNYWRASWHYAGTFWWAKLGDIGSKWQIVDRSWCGSESWPGSVVDWRGGGELFCPRMRDPIGEMYCWQLEPQWQAWQQLNRRHLCTPLPVSSWSNS